MPAGVDIRLCILDSLNCFLKLKKCESQVKYHDYMNQLKKFDLLILDEFLLKPTNDSERSDLLEVIEMEM